MFNRDAAKTASLPPRPNPSTPGFAVALRPGAQRRERIAEVVDALLNAKALVVFVRHFQVDTLVTEFDLRRQAPEQIGRQHDVTFFRVKVRNLANMLVDAENFLGQD